MIPLPKTLIYLDHAATTPLDPRVLEAMQPYFMEDFGNPSSFHTLGVRAKEAITMARKTIALLLSAHDDEIVFTSGGTEANNLALAGIIQRMKEPIPSTLPHVVASTIEHHSVLEPLLHWQKTKQIELTLVPVDRDGCVLVKDVEAALTPSTVLVSIMFANNEIGTIQPIADIGRALLVWRKHHATIYPFFHSDACQAAGSLEINVDKLHVDLLTANAAKMYGPKGIGLLYMRRGIKLEPLMRGGGQERNLRSGTENVPAIVGFAKAFALAQAERAEEVKCLTALRDRLVAGLLKISKARLNGHPTERLANSVNVSFLDIEGEAAVLYLDAVGIMASTGSACASASLNPSHVILATGLAYEAAHGSIRFTLGHATTAEHIDYVIKIMPSIVERLRQMSPTKLDMKYFV